MSFELNIAQSPTENVRRILTDEVKFIEVQMQATEDNRHLAVHLTRKRFKRIRAVLRLIRDEIGEAVYQQQNQFYRDASRLLSPVRDSAVLVDLFNTLVETDHDAGAQTAGRSCRLLQCVSVDSRQRP